MATELSPARAGSDVAGELATLLAQWEDIQPRGRVLIASLAPLELPPLLLGECLLYVAPPDTLTSSAKAGADSTDEYRLPISSATFDVVIGYRLMRLHINSLPFLHEALRILRPNGTLALITDANDFRSAPLPGEAPVHLLRRALWDAGISDAKITRNGTRVLAIAQRSSPRSPRV